MTAPPQGRLVALALALVCGWALLPSSAWAQPCCSGSGAYLPARLKIHEQALVAVQLRATDGIGSLEADGRFQSAPAGTRELVLEQALVGALRVIERGQVSLVVPFLETSRASRGAADWGGGVGDASVSGRYDFINTAESERLPALALVAGLTVPSGRAPEQARSPLLTDATGTGAFQASVGGSIEKIFGNLILSLNLLVSGSSARVVGGVHEQLGPQLSALFAAGYFFHNQGAVALAVTAAQSLDATLNGERLPASGRGLTSLSLTGGIPLDPVWRIQGALSSDLPALGSNHTVGVGGTFTLVRSWL